MSLGEDWIGIGVSRVGGHLEWVAKDVTGHELEYTRRSRDRRPARPHLFAARYYLVPEARHGSVAAILVRATGEGACGPPSVRRCTDLPR